MAAVVDVEVPDIGDFTDVPVIEILVSVGDAIDKDTPLVTLESDKATMEIPSPEAGIVRELRVKLGDTVSQGTAILTLEPAGEGAPDVQSGGAAPAAVAVEAEAQAAPPPAATHVVEAPTTAPPESDANGETPPYASPSVRRLAREQGIDLHGLHGSGRLGRITAEDLRGGGGAASPVPGLLPWPQIDFTQFGEIERQPLSRIKKIAKANLARNWALIPHVTHNEDADITEVEAFRKQTNAENPDTKVTMVAIVLKACVATLKAFPEVNASLDGDDLILKRYYHLGFAADTEQGLVVPVIRDVDRKGLLEIADELTALSTKARAGKLSPTEMQGATFTVSSLGGIGGTGFTPIINAPEVAILGVSRSATKPLWDGNSFVPRLIVPLSLSYDHRVVDGALAARFMVHLSGVLSDYRRVLL